MKLYTLTVTAHLDDLDSPSMHVDTEVELISPEVYGLVMQVMPAHLRQVADKIEGNSKGAD